MAFSSLVKQAHYLVMLNFHSRYYSYSHVFILILKRKDTN